MSTIDIVRMILDIVLQLVPHEQAKTLLDEQAVKRANAVADVAEAVKFGGA